LPGLGRWRIDLGRAVVGPRHRVGASGADLVTSRRREGEPVRAQATSPAPAASARPDAPRPPESTAPIDPADARSRLIAAARRLFAERGFHGTTADQLIDAAGLTRGALYRDFADKRDLFRAVFETVEESLGLKIAAALRPEDSLDDQRRAALRVFLNSSRDAEVRRIVLLEGPVVLGWEEWREIDGRYSLAFVSGLLEAEMAAGRRPRQPVRPLAHLIVGAMNEAGLAVAFSRDPEAAIEEFVAGVDSFWSVSEPRDGGVE
jgi:AcrR family transcriptional regulator